MLKKAPTPPTRFREEGALKSPYSCLPRDLDWQPYSLRSSKAEEGGEYETLRGVIIYLEPDRACFDNIAKPVRIILYWGDMFPVKTLIAISEQLLVIAPCLIKFQVKLNSVIDLHCYPVILEATSDAIC